MSLCDTYPRNPCLRRRGKCSESLLQFKEKLKEGKTGYSMKIDLRSTEGQTQGMVQVLLKDLLMTKQSMSLCLLDLAFNVYNTFHIKLY